MDTGALADSGSRENTPALQGSCDDKSDDGNGLVDEDDPACLVGDNLGGGNAIDAPVDCLDTGFYTAKAANFAAARRRIFRHAVSADPAVASSRGGGCGEAGGNDFIQSRDTGTTREECRGPGRWRSPP